MKTKAMAHQSLGRKLLLQHPEYYALACEQGTGKSWMLLADAEQRLLLGDINGLLVVAPSGVHTNWIKKEAPAHLGVTWKGAAYKSGANKKLQRKIEEVMEPEEGVLSILTINIEALNTKNGFACCMRFLRRFNVMMVVDESQKIKNPSAARTKKVMQLGACAVSRRIASGTMITNGPADAFAQYQFLRPGLLGTTSYRAFVAEYNYVLPPDNPLVMKAKERSRYDGADPQILATDPVTGRPKTRNLDKLSALMAPHTYRVLKRDCLDLPPKVYQTHYFDMTPKQRKLYEQIQSELRYERPDGEVDLYTALVLGNKLRQVTSGFIMVDEEPQLLSLEENPRMKAYLELREELPGKVITWAKYRAEISALVKALRKKGRKVVEYHGGTTPEARSAAIEAIQQGDATDIIMNEAGATGITLTAAETAVYYSHDYSLETRSQGEDRNHRIGTVNNVLYIDLVAEGTIDERIALALQAKSFTAATIMDAL